LDRIDTTFYVSRVCIIISYLHNNRWRSCNLHERKQCIRMGYVRSRFSTTIRKASSRLVSSVLRTNVERIKLVEQETKRKKDVSEMLNDNVLATENRAINPRKRRPYVFYGGNVTKTTQRETFYIYFFLTRVSIVNIVITCVLGQSSSSSSEPTTQNIIIITTTTTLSIIIIIAYAVYSRAQPSNHRPFISIAGIRS